MATVSGVWVWNSTPAYPENEISANVDFISNSLNFAGFDIQQDNVPGNSAFINYIGQGFYGYENVYNTFQWVDEVYRTIDFGSTPQTVSDTFYTYLTANATKQAASVPTPDWANCFVKTSAGNKAVEKVWIKQGSSLNVVWEAPAVTHKLFASEDMSNNGGELSLFINSKSYNLEGNSTDYVEIKTGDVIEGSAFISHNELMALALKGVDTGTIYAQGDGGIDGAYLNVSYTVPSALTEDLIFVEVMA